MAGLFEFRGKWIVTLSAIRTEGGRRKYPRKAFGSESEARDYLAANNLVLGPRRGRRARTTQEVRDHILEHAALTDDGCMEWTGTIGQEGYGTLNWKQPDGSVIAGAHRLSYHLFVAPVVRGLVIDHLCRNRACVRPDHLDMVRQRENVMRSPIAPGALNAAKTHCAQGHPYSPENTYVYTFKTRKTTTRICRTCQRAYYERRRAARMGAVA